MYEKGTSKKRKGEAASEDEGSGGLCDSGVQAAGKAAREDEELVTHQHIQEADEVSGGGPAGSRKAASEHEELITHQLNHFQEAGSGKAAREDEELVTYQEADKGSGGESAGSRKAVSEKEADKGLGGSAEAAIVLTALSRFYLLHLPLLILLRIYHSCIVYNIAGRCA